MWRTRVLLLNYDRVEPLEGIAPTLFPITNGGPRFLGFNGVREKRGSAGPEPSGERSPCPTVSQSSAICSIACSQVSPVRSPRVKAVMTSKTASEKPPTLRTSSRESLPATWVVR